MVDALQRLVNLYGLLLRASEQTPLTQADAHQELADQYDAYGDGETGRKAFRRDRRHLEAAGVPLRMSYATGKAGVPGWWIPVDEWFLGHLDLTDDERAALLRATRMVDFRDVLWSRLAGAKLGAGQVQATDTVAVFIAPEALPSLLEARARASTATFRYGGTDRTVDPYALANASGHWYLVGWEHAADDIRCFRVDRIADGTVSLGVPGAFEVPDGFDPGPHVPADKWTWGSELFEVRVAVDPEVAAIVVRDVGGELHTHVLDDGRVEMRFACTHRGVFLSWVLNLGYRAEVLAPADLRAEVVDRLRAIAAGGGGRLAGADGVAV